MRLEKEEQEKIQSEERERGRVIKEEREKQKQERKTGPSLSCTCEGSSAQPEEVNAWGKPNPREHEHITQFTPFIFLLVRGKAQAANHQDFFLLRTP